MSRTARTIAIAVRLVPYVLIAWGLYLGLALGEWLVAAGCLIYAIALLGLIWVQNHLIRHAEVAGWMKGRHAMFSSLAESQHRGMDIQQWLMSEIERDTVVLAQASGMIPPGATVGLVVVEDDDR